jgi:hypothetical protein
LDILAVYFWVCGIESSDELYRASGFSTTCESRQGTTKSILLLQVCLLAVWAQVKKTCPYTACPRTAFPASRVNDLFKREIFLITEEAI